MKREYLKHIQAILAATAILLVVSCNSERESASLTSFPEQYSPKRVGVMLTNRFLEQGHSQYGSPLREKEPRTQITYPDVCVWLGGLWFAQTTHDTILTNRLEDRFRPLLAEESYLQPKPNHVDNNVFGALALELYRQRGNEEYKELGMMYADTQWELPVAEHLDSKHNSNSKTSALITDKNLYLASEKEWADKGYSWQTRVWLDDMFMITSVQAQAYKVTGNRKYIDRSAREMEMYLDSIQTDNGLVYHAPEAPFYWGRGNGWLAVGFAELLRNLPSDNEHCQYIMESYKKMMATLLTCQAENGMWRQLVDDKESWYETSGTAMFTYAMIIGVNNGWLDRPYAVAARKGWMALVDNINTNGDVCNVCEGTNIGDNRQHYIDRRALTGDLHGQAPVLWCANALLEASK